jgi:ABC-type antimicrobial peptide transport system permease subunit
VLASAFGGVGALLAMVGLYGVVAFQTSQRRREFGIRVALGADRRGIRRMVLADGLRHALTGIAAGLVVAWWLGVAIQRLVPGVAAWDPAAFAAGAVALVAAALVAADLPARRAASADPMTTLRRD